MDSNIYTLKEILETTETKEAEFSEWTHAGLIEPIGQADDSTPYYGEEVIERIQHIKQFNKMGYSNSEIQRIMKKVGIPAAKRGKQATASGRDNMLTIGSLAEQAGVSPRTIKHWEEKGIIEPDMRSQGGFRLFRQYYVYFCKLIQDLQLFGYSLDEIKTISDFFRDFVHLRSEHSAYPPKEAQQRLSAMQDEISRLFEKTSQLKEGISRWEELLRTHRKHIISLQNKLSKINSEEFE